MTIPGALRPAARDPADPAPNGRARRALAAYRHLAWAYDWHTEGVQPLREQVVQLLRLHPGDTVIDVGCGTGLCFPFIMAAVGPTGLLIGVEQSREMLAGAEERVKRHGWDNVDLICSAVKDAPMPGRADAALFCLTHDILQDEHAVANVVTALRAGARVAVLGAKWASWRDLWWAPLAVPAVNLLVVMVNGPYVTTFDSFHRPWRHLARSVPNLRTKTILCGGGYLAWGDVAAGGERGLDR